MNTLKALLVTACIAATQLTFAQDKKMPPLDPSPMDMAYYPVMFPYICKVKGEPGTLVARTVYSRPQKKGRPIFGNLVEYGKVWRLGANEATEIEFFRPVTIGGKPVAKGRYTMYAIPTEKNWTIILNRQTDIWGAYKYEEAKDALRVDVKVKPLAETQERLVYKVHSKGFSLDWDKVSVPVAIK